MSWVSRYLPSDFQEQIRAAVTAAELCTSGEIRVYLCRYSFFNPLTKAGFIFRRLKMQATRHRNGVLIFFALKSHKLAIYGDKGIYEITGSEFWDETEQQMINLCRQAEIMSAVLYGIHEVGQKLKSHFPYDRNNDQNELSNDAIVG